MASNIPNSDSPKPYQITPTDELSAVEMASPAELRTLFLTHRYERKNIPLATPRPNAQTFDIEGYYGFELIKNWNGNTRREWAAWVNETIFLRAGPERLLSKYFHIASHVHLANKAAYYNYLDGVKNLVSQAIDAGSETAMKITKTIVEYMKPPRENPQGDPPDPVSFAEWLEKYCWANPTKAQQYYDYVICYDPQGVKGSEEEQKADSASQTGTDATQS